MNAASSVCIYLRVVTCSCLAVVNPLRKRHLSGKSSLAILGVIWVLALLFGLPNFFYAKVSAYYFYWNVGNGTDDVLDVLRLQRVCSSPFPYSRV